MSGNDKALLAIVFAIGLVLGLIIGVILTAYVVPV